MAGTYAPTITTSPTPLIEGNSVSDTPYDEVVASLAANVYVCDNLQIQASSVPQLNQLIYVNEYDSNGNLQTHTITPDTDPYQYQTSLKVYFEDEGLILNGQTSLDVDLLGLSSTQLDFDNSQFDPSDTEDIIKAEETGELKEYRNESLETISSEKALKDKTDKTFDYDLLNRSGLYPNTQTSLEDGQTITLDNLFDGFVDEI